MHFSKHKLPIRLWWRRQLFRLRRVSRMWFVIVFICTLFLIIMVPNPFSAQYSRIPIDQDVHWKNVKEILEVKAQVFQNETLLNNVKVIKNGSEERQFNSMILIVLYTTIFRDKKFCSYSVNRIFGKSCPSKRRCLWSCDHEKFREADALIFHAYDIPLYRAPIPNRSETKPNSVWILWSDEPPSMINYALLKSYHFNWTISYKLNSEVSIATYGLFSKRDSRLSDNEYQRWIRKEFSNRENGALWFVSNCNAKKRLELFYNLKHASKLLIEGYGRCVDYYPIHLCGSSSQCEYDYMSMFKFYLGFESNTCRDYITEKFYKAFYYGLIPIVYGPERSDYNRVAPKDSFIHIDDFDKDMNALATHLEEIHSNITLFSIYHEWRKNYEIIIDGKALERVRMCELCQRLINLRKGEISYYENIDEFYNDKCDYI
ncbi:unnamed protein product [Rotaria sp. Silwood2]|nr:unnamed protein product [Rotaria sp. Silwood2]CAF3028780.1 unnamed protein product [Rotaria sp. Silwood2]CAF4075238.1 unnamed protein product [Rotaria sp. Silwood2]CAF4242439.1 unnamed protein product [Rotaria sp. Silwood2]